MAEFDDLQAHLADYRLRIEGRLRDWLPPGACASPRLADAMSYSVLGGGKRLRAILAYAACELAGGTREQADAPAAALELIHAYSLVHDDLPAMDDDDLRRGRPTCHIAFDEATAILAGDTLHTLAFELLAVRGNYSDQQRLAMISTLARAAGAAGMAAGQMQDIQAQQQDMTLEALEEIHFLKTGRLITASLQLGHIASGSNDRMLESLLGEYGDAIGLAFQIQDDILDVTASSNDTGKTSGSDARLGKPTYPELLGLEESQALARKQADQARDLLTGYDARADLLRDLAEFTVLRNH